MAIIFALPKVYDSVVALFLAEETAIVNLFGWRAPDQKEVTGPRIAWVPGDDAGALGDMLPPKQPGRLERSLGTLGELFHVVIIGADSASPENERAQYQALRVMFDAWWRGVYLAMPGRVRITSASWVTDRKVRRHGAALIVTCAVEAMVPDVAPEVAPVDSHAEIDTELLDNTESDSISAEEP